MNSVWNAAAAGAVGALTTNVLHEVVRRTVPRAPRVDLLGMQALVASLRAGGAPAPTGEKLYRTTLAADLFSNAAYFALAAAAPGNGAVVLGFALGAAAGVGAVVLPPAMGLSGRETTSRTPETAAMTIGLYTAGGIAAGMTARALRG